MQIKKDGKLYAKKKAEEIYEQYIHTRSSVNVCIILKEMGYTLEFIEPKKKENIISYDQEYKSLEIIDLDCQGELNFLLAKALYFLTSEPNKPFYVKSLNEKLKPNNEKDLYANIFAMNLLLNNSCILGLKFDLRTLYNKNYILQKKSKHFKYLIDRLKIPSDALILKLFLLGIIDRYNFFYYDKFFLEPQDETWNPKVYVV